MWIPIILSVLTWGYNEVSFKDNVTTGNFEFAVGDHFKDLTPETQEYFHKMKYTKQDQPRHGSDYMAANTDNCWGYDAECQPDYKHYIYAIPMIEHAGYYYYVTFSYNWKILSITNTYTHSS